METKEILVLRHAKSSWNHPGLSDFARPLNKRGKKAAPRMGRHLFEMDIVPDIILCSTAKRARSTAEKAAEASGFPGEIVYVEEFYHGWPSDYIDALKCLPDHVSRAMVVGHNPGMELLIESLTSQAERFPTAALAQIQVELGSWSELAEESSGTLKQLWFPRNLSE